MELGKYAQMLQDEKYKTQLQDLFKKNATAGRYITKLPDVPSVFEPLLKKGQTVDKATDFSKQYTNPTLPNNQTGGANAGNGKPQYNTAYDEQMASILAQIQGRGPFQYDAASDPLYNIYRDLYMQNGRRAMEDTIGQAAAMTGGYGNSYAQSAGQQQYGQYMEGLNAVVPQLQQQAYSQYLSEGDQLAQQYQLAADASDREYSRWKDMMERWDKEHQSSGSGSTSKKTDTTLEELLKLLQSGTTKKEQTAPTIVGTTPNTQSNKHTQQVTVDDQVQAILEEYRKLQNQKNKNGNTI